MRSSKSIIYLLNWVFCAKIIAFLFLILELKLSISKLGGFLLIGEESLEDHNRCSSPSHGGKPEEPYIHKQVDSSKKNINLFNNNQFK